MRSVFSLLAILLAAAPAAADPLSCELASYKALPGLTASKSADALTITWDGERQQELRLQLTLNQGTPTLRELAVRSGRGWSTIATDLTPEFRIASGIRRMSNQQMQPLAELKVPITPAILDANRWDAFWDAPLFVGGTPRQGGNPPPAAGVANQPGLPRKAEEVHRETATFHAIACFVSTNGARLEVTFPGAQLGVFAGALKFTVYRGANLLRQEIVASTSASPVAYKYDAGPHRLARYCQHLAGIPLWRRRERRRRDAEGVEPHGHRRDRRRQYRRLSAASHLLLGARD